MFRFKYLFLTVAAIALPACGAEAGSPSDTTAVQTSEKTQSVSSAPKWNVIEDSSHLKFSAKQEGEAFTGDFTVFKADINFDPENLGASSVTVTVPLKQVDAGTGDRNSTLPGAAWFSTKKFPEAVYTSSDISQSSDGEYVAKGTLMLKGKDQPLELPFSLIIESGRAVMTSTVILDRTNWSVGEDPWNTDEWVSKNVTLDILITATKS